MWSDHYQPGFFEDWLMDVLWVKRATPVVSKTWGLGLFWNPPGLTARGWSLSTRKPVGCSDFSCVFSTTAPGSTFSPSSRERCATNCLCCAVLVRCQVSNKTHQMPPEKSFEAKVWPFIRHKRKDKFCGTLEFQHSRLFQGSISDLKPPSEITPPFSVQLKRWKCILVSEIFSSQLQCQNREVFRCVAKLSFLNIMILRKLQVQAQPFLKLRAIIPLGYPNFRIIASPNKSGPCIVDCQHSATAAHLIIDTLQLPNGEEPFGHRRRCFETTQERSLAGSGIP